MKKRPKVEKPKATENKAKDVETKTVRLINLKVQLADAVMRQSRMSEALNKQNILCNRLATEIEKFGE